MALEVRRKEKEPVQSLLRRFAKKVQQSGILVQARKIRFRERNKSRQMKKRAALRREELRKEYERKKKLGELDKT
jgi:ribosomal protein S21